MSQGSELPDEERLAVVFELIELVAAAEGGQTEVGALIGFQQATVGKAVRYGLVGSRVARGLLSYLKVANPQIDMAQLVAKHRAAIDEKLGRVSGTAQATSAATGTVTDAPARTVELESSDRYPSRGDLIAQARAAGTPDRVLARLARESFKSTGPTGLDVDPGPAHWRAELARLVREDRLSVDEIRKLLAETAPDPEESRQMFGAPKDVAKPKALRKR